MDLQKVTKDYRMSQWMQIIREKQTSGQKVDDFCAERGISRNAYFYWQRKLRKAVCTDLSTGNKTLASVPEGWVQLSSKDQKSETISIEISGCRVNVDADTSPELLKKVCYILRAL